MFRFMLMLSAILVPSLAFAVEGQDLLPPETVVILLQFLEHLPYVGPVIVMILKWIAIIAPIMTAISFIVQGVLVIPELVARYSGAPALAEKIKYYSDKVNYWLKYLSIRNAKK